MNLFLFGYDYVLWNVEALAHYYVGLGAGKTCYYELSDTPNLIVTKDEMLPFTLRFLGLAGSSLWPVLVTKYLGCPSSKFWTKHHKNFFSKFKIFYFYF